MENWQFLKRVYYDTSTHSRCVDNGENPVQISNFSKLVTDSLQAIIMFFRFLLLKARVICLLTIRVLEPTKVNLRKYGYIFRLT